MLFLAYLYFLTLFSVQLMLAYGSPHKRDGVTAYIDPAHNPNNKIFKRYTAIGDRLAAGVCIECPKIENDTDIQRCQRTVDSYPYQFVNEFGGSIGLETFNFPACDLDQDYSTIGDQIESGFSLSPLPRVWYDFGQPDLVTISIGVEQNDAYTHIREKCIYPLAEVPADNVKYENECDNAIAAGRTIIMDPNIQEEYEDLFKKIQTHDLAPNQKRKVFVMGSPHPYSLTGSSCPDDHRSPPHRTSSPINKFFTEWNAALHEFADNVGVIFVDVDKKFDWHRICDTDPWFHVRAGQDFMYPTPKGYSAMKDAFAEVALGIFVEHNEENGLMVVPNTIPNIKNR